MSLLSKSIAHSMKFGESIGQAISEIGKKHHVASFNLINKAEHYLMGLASASNLDFSVFHELLSSARQALQYKNFDKAKSELQKLISMFETKL